MLCNLHDIRSSVNYIPGADLRESHCSPYRNIVGSSLLGIKSDESSRAISPTMDPQPLLPLLAPSPLMPFTNNSVPRLSGIYIHALLYYGTKWFKLLYGAFYGDF